MSLDLRATEARRSQPGGSGTSLATSSALLTLTQVVGNTGFFVAILVIARELTRDGRGIVAFATTAALIVARVSEFGMTNATTVVASRRAEKRPRLLANTLLFALLCGVVGGSGVALAMSVGGVGPSLTSLELAAVAGGVLGNTLLDAGCSYLLGVQRVKLWLIVAAPAPWIYAGALIVLAAIGDVSVSAALVAWAVAHLLWGFGASIMSVTIHSIGRPDWQLFRETLHLGVRAWGGTLSRFLNFRLDQLVLGLLATQSTLAVYATAVNASEVSLYVPVAVAAAAIPTIARVSPEHRVAQVLATVRRLLVITFAVVVAAALVGVPLVPLMFGGRYQSAVLPYVILLPGALGYVAIGVFSSALVNSERPFLSSLPSAVSLVTGVAFDLILIPPFQASGAAFAATLAFFAGGVTAVVAYRRLTPFGWNALIPRRADWRVLLAFRRAHAFRDARPVKHWYDQGHHEASLRLQSLTRSKRMRTVLLMTVLRGVGAMLRDTRRAGSAGWLGAYASGANDAVRQRRQERRQRLRLRSSQYYAINHAYRRVRILTGSDWGSGLDWNGVRMLGYHRVTDERDPLRVRPSVFRAQMEWLLERDLKPIRVDRAISLLPAGADGTYFSVTFDDGYYDNLEIALPILEDLRIPATIYVVTAVIDGTASFDWYRNPPPALSWDDLRAIQSGGLVDVQPHTRTHPALTRLGLPAARDEIAGSRADVEANLGLVCTSFAYPAGIYGSREAGLVREAGFAAGLTTDPGVNVDLESPFGLRRTLLSAGDTLTDFQAKMRGVLDRTSALERMIRARRATPEG
jgi:O-antigen/teichoic acid export membrane protein/peptidoglycan/xylan/chitin deacetylase (PgdA/CDA1 family)